MNRAKIVRIIKEEVSRKLKESRGEQLRREIDDAVNGTDYGYSSIKPGDDEAANRFKNLEIDDEAHQTKSNTANNSQQESEIEYYKNGQKRSERFFVDGQYHRIGGPALTYWHENGKKRFEEFWVGGQIHRTDGPAITYWHENGQKAREEFWVHDRCHRTDGPAISNWADDGEKSTELFAVDGRQLSEEEWWSKYGQYLNRDYLDLDGESEGTKPIDDKELEVRGRGLDLDDAKNRPEKEDRFKPSIAGQRLTEKKVRLNKTKTRLILI